MDVRTVIDHLAPYEGTIDWAEVLAALEEVSFANPRIFEVKNREDGAAGIPLFRRLVEIARQWSSATLG